MSGDRFKTPSFVNIILHRSDMICLLKRARTPKYFPGMYVLPGGGVDQNESFTAAAAREAREEIGIVIMPSFLKCVHVCHVATPAGPLIDVYFEASSFEGEPSISEPDKCDEVAWFLLDALPLNLIPEHKHALAMIKQGIMFSEWGW